MKQITTNEMYSILNSSSRDFKDSVYTSLREGDSSSLLTYRQRCRCACVAYVFGGNDDRFKLYLASKLDGVCASSNEYRMMLSNWRPCVAELTALFHPNRLEDCFSSLDPVFKPLDINPDETVPYTQGFLRWCERELGRQDIITFVVAGIVKRACRNAV